MSQKLDVVATVSGTATAVGLGGEVVTFGGDTPVTITTGALAGAAALGSTITNGVASILNSFAGKSTKPVAKFVALYAVDRATGHLAGPLVRRFTTGSSERDEAYKTLLEVFAVSAVDSHMAEANTCP